MDVRFFQHLEPGDMLGKITKLKYIDDISDDEMILYYFEDGTKCNSEFVAAIDFDGDPIEHKMVMVELAGPQYTWQFTKKEVIAEVSKMVKDDVTGEVFEAVGPDVHLNNAYGGDQRTIEEVRQNSMKTEVKRPRRPAKIKHVSDDEFLLSNHPELEHSKPYDSSVVIAKKKPVVRPANDFDFDKADVVIEKSAKIENDSSVLSNDSTSIKTEPVNIKLNLDQLNFKKVVICDGDRNETIDTDEFCARLRTSTADIEQLRKNAEYKTPFDLCVENEDVLVKNMIDKSKKKNAKIMLAVSIPLPPKEVYKTIKDVYEDGMSDEFVKSVTARISMDKLLESLAAGMKAFYEDTPQISEQNE